MIPRGLTQATAAFLMLCAAPAAADGPALAHVTLDGRVITLSAQNAPFQPPMIRPEGEVLHLSFADLRLGFPLPPLLELSLRRGPDDWRVTALRLQTSHAIYISDTAQILEIIDPDSDDFSMILNAEALAPAPHLGTALVTLRIEITLRSP